MPDNLTLNAARHYTARGLPVFPLNGKTPITEHGLNDATLNDQQLATWFASHHNIGIAIPPGIVVLDVDPRNGGDRTLNNWCAEHGVEWLADVPRVHTGGNGTHYYYKYDGRTLKKAIDGIDFQRAGKYVVAPPSTTTGPYTWEIGLPTFLDDLPDLPGWLLDLATPEPATPDISDRVYAGGPDELDQAAHAATSWPDLLTRHGWTAVSHDKWRHPSSDNQFSATITNDCLFVYTPNTPFPVTEPGDPHGITLFRAIAILEHRSDCKAAAAHLRTLGHLPPLAEPVDLHALIAPPRTEPTSLELKLSGYLDWPRDFAADDDLEQRWLVEPVIAIGRAHALYAGAKTGKSLLMLALAAALASGRAFLDMPEHPPTSVLYCDYEMTRDDIIERLRTYGYQPDDLAMLHYALLPSGDGLDTQTGGAEVIHDALTLGAALVVIDTTARAITGAENDADSLRNFYRHTGAPLKRRGVSVVRLDHAGKDSGKGQRGTSAKNDDVDVVWRLTIDSPGHYAIEATHRRMGWVPNTVRLNLVEKDDETGWYLQTSKTSWPPGVKEKAADLTRAGVVAGMSVRDSKALLRASDGQAGKNETVEAAIRYRKDYPFAGLIDERAGRVLP